MSDSRNPSLISSTFKLQVVIGMLTTIIKIGKYLPLIVFAFASLNLTLAILDFTIWDSLPFGILNTILAIGGFVFTGQLLQRRRSSRREYLIKREHEAVDKQAEEIQRRMIVVE
jgi:uncharacterized integral membrane protein